MTHVADASVRNMSIVIHQTELLFDLIFLCGICDFIYDIQFVEIQKQTLYMV